MAAKNHDSKKSNKRKQDPSGAQGGVDKSPLKKSKFAQSKHTKPPNKDVKKPPNKDLKKPFESSKQRSDKPMFGNFDKDMNVQKTKRESRLEAKDLTEARKKRRKQHYTLEQELAKLWEKIRQRRNIAKEDRSKLVSESLQKMKGKISEIAVSHVSSRVLQTCVKYCSQAERDVVFEELQPHFLTLACSTHAVFLVKKLLDTASKKHMAEFITSLRGHVAPFLRHMVGSIVVEHAYYLGNASQKQELLKELYSPELQLFKDLASMKESRLVDIISKLGLQRASVLRHMASVIQPILEKGIVDHTITHRVLMEYFTIADKYSATEVIQLLSSSLLLRMIHTKDGSRIGMLCVKHGSAKERKIIIKGMKCHVTKTANEQYGSMVLACIFSIVDDTRLITQIIIRELQTSLKELVLHKYGRRPLLQLLRPNCPRYFSPDDLASFDLFIPSLSKKGENEIISETKPSKLSESGDMEDPETKPSELGESGDMEAKSDVDTGAEVKEVPSPDEGIPLVEGGKKDPFLRRQQLLVKSGLAESLVDICIESAAELLCSNVGKEVIFEVASGGADGILHPHLDEKLYALHEVIASLAAEPKSGDDHVLENFHSSRVIRKLVLDCPSFASILWKDALKGRCKIWAQGHSIRVVCAFMESTDLKVRQMAKEELQPLIDGGILKIPEKKVDQ